jgi:hypothetical protein
MHPCRCSTIFSTVFFSSEVVSHTQRTLLASHQPSLLRICFTQNSAETGSLHTIPSSCAEKRFRWIIYVRVLVRARNERYHMASPSNVERSPCKPAHTVSDKKPTWQRAVPIRTHMHPLLACLSIRPGRGDNDGRGGGHGEGDNEGGRVEKTSAAWA